MSRTRQLITVAACLATFAWLLAPELRASPAVLWPSVLAVGLVFVTRDLYLALGLGAFSGALLLAGGNPWTAFQSLWRDHVLPALSDRWNLSVLVFTLMMGGFVEVLHRNGGMAALTYRFLGGAQSPRRAGLGAFFLGWLVFFDGLASSMLVGKTLRPMADRAGLSREKLAFIVDSTSSPIAGLALLSTWVAYEMSVIRQGLENTGDPALAVAVSPFSWLVLSLPFRFYNWFMLWLVFLVAWGLRDWGPMLEAERRARARQQEEPHTPGAEGGGAGAAHAWVPLAVLVAGVFGGLYVDGGGLAEPLSFAGLVRALGKADAASVFVLATAVATLLALGLSLGRRGVDGGRTDDGGTQAFLHGMQQMFLPALILVCAWMLNSVLKELGTARYLVTLLGDRLPAAWLPALVFLLAAVVSFSTGTSWGTMAVLIPLTVPLAVELTGFAAGAPVSPVLAATVGAVLAGAVFGDHCSPLSDTTIVSALSSECDVLAHVRTQLPYALAAAAVATLLGYLPAGYGVAPGWLLAAGALACWLLVRYGGKRVPEVNRGVGNAPSAGLTGDQTAGR